MPHSAWQLTASVVDYRAEHHIPPLDGQIIMPKVLTWIILYWHAHVYPSWGAKYASIETFWFGFLFSLPLSRCLSVTVSSCFFFDSNHSGCLVSLLEMSSVKNDLSFWFNRGSVFYPLFVSRIKVEGVYRDMIKHFIVLDGKFSVG